MKIINLIKSEFLKNYNLKKLILIILVLLVSSFALVEGSMFTTYNYDYYGPDQSQIKYYEENYEKLLREKDRTIEEEFDLYSLKVNIEISKWLYEKKSSNDWRKLLSNELEEILNENYVIKLIKENPSEEKVNMICEYENHYGYGYHSFLIQVKNLCNSFDNLDQKYLENQKVIDAYSKILKEDKYYLYVKYEFDHNLIDEKNREIAQIVVDNKIEDDRDFRVSNYRQYSPPLESCDIEDTHIVGYTPEQALEYKEKCLEDNKEKEKNSAIILYSSKHNIPQDLEYDNWHSGPDPRDLYVSSKRMVNKVFHLSLVVLVLVSITSSGIVSKEHNTGTIKNIITTPVKRWKILLSKFIYLILHTYIIWLIGLFVLSIYSGIRLGFQDLFLPKLIYSNGHVIEINYYLYLLKDLFLVSIPVIAFLSILFFLSTVTLNTTLTAAITSILGIISPILYFICSNYQIKEIVDLPFIYFDCGFIFSKHEWYVRIIDMYNFSLQKGIIISIITTIILYTITNIVYIKRDIKN